MIGVGVIFATIGAIVSLRFLLPTFKSLQEICSNVLFTVNEPFSKRYGQWAVITGSSDGIGREYARNLARKGMNIVLISRTEAKLFKLAEEIRSKYGVEVKWIAIDFSKGDRIYESIMELLAGIEIGILVNNVGMVHQHPASVDEVSLDELQQIISVNMLPTVTLTHLLLPKMKRRRRGMVVNVSSGSGVTPIPYVTLYAASKAFLDNFTMGLQLELAGSGVQCQLVYPLFVDTKMTEQWQQVGFWRMLSVGVERYTRMAVWTIGKVGCTTGHWYHALQFTIFKAVPQKIAIAAIIMKYMERNNF